MQEKAETKWYGWALLILVIGLVIYSRSSDKPLSQTNALQVLHPQWVVAGKDDAITIITRFSESGQRIVASTDGESTCGVGMSEGEWDKSAHQFTGREFPNSNPIFLTIYSDGSGGQLEQRTRNGSTETCGVSVSFDGR